MENNGNVQLTLEWTPVSKLSFEMYILMVAAPRPFCDVTQWKAEDMFWRMMLGRECAWFTWDEETARTFYTSIPMWKKAAWNKALAVLMGERMPGLWSQTLSIQQENSKEEEK